MPASRQEILSALVAAFPREQVSPDTYRVYLRHLADVPPEALAEAVSALIQTERYFPPVSVIRAAVAEHALELPTEAQALAQVADRMDWAQAPAEGRPAPPAVHALVREALDLVGGYHAFRSTDNAGVTRGQFLKLYRDLRASGIREAQVARQLGAGPRRQELDP